MDAMIHVARRPYGCGAIIIWDQERRLDQPQRMVECYFWDRETKSVSAQRIMLLDDFGDKVEYNLLLEDVARNKLNGMAGLKHPQTDLLVSEQPEYSSERRDLFGTLLRLSYSAKELVSHIHRASESALMKRLAEDSLRFSSSLRIDDLSP